MNNPHQAAGEAEHTPEISSQSGCPVILIGRKDAETVWAVRKEDGALRDYWHSELRIDGGWPALQPVIALLPLMRRKAADQARAALALAKEGQ